jgi:nucleoside-diphosphate-sugar epimerase
MMYMPDAVSAAIDLMAADPARLTARNAYNVSAMSFDPEMIAAEIRRHLPGFTLSYEVNQTKQGIANSWPKSMDDSAARADWGFGPKYDLARMTGDMLKVLGAKHEKGEL